MADVFKPDPLQVKGSSLRSKLDFVELRFGVSAREALEQRLAAQGIPVVLSGGWYDYAAYTDLLSTIAKTHFGGSLTALGEIGAASAESALNSTYAAFKRATVDEFFQGISRLHALLYSEGQIEAAVSDSDARLTLRCPRTPAEEDLWVATGFYRRGTELCGKHDVRVEFVRAEKGARFTVSWVR